MLKSSNRWLIGSLVALNAVLAAGLFVHYKGSLVHSAIAGPMFASRGNYLVAAGNDGTQGIVWIFDEDNELLAGVATQAQNSTRPYFLPTYNVGNDLKRAQMRQ